MADLEPRGAKVRKAVQHVSDAIRADPGRAVAPLIEEATLRFDLDPKQSRSLRELFRREKPTGPTGGDPAR